jgi:hypothetical protein
MDRTMLVVRGSTKKYFHPKREPLTSIKMVCKRSMVGAPGIEPGTSCTPCKRASRTAPRPVGQGAIIAGNSFSGNVAP